MKTNQIQVNLREGKKFIRRSDLIPFTRLYIAFTALVAQHEKRWGVMTK